MTVACRVAVWHVWCVQFFGCDVNGTVGAGCSSRTRVGLVGRCYLYGRRRLPGWGIRELRSPGIGGGTGFGFSATLCRSLGLPSWGGRCHSGLRCARGSVWSLEQMWGSRVVSR